MLRLPTGSVGGGEPGSLVGVKNAVVAAVAYTVLIKGGAMGVVVPIVLFLALAALVLVAPRAGTFRARRRSRGLAQELATVHGFESRPDVTLGRLPLAGPPFHYGTARTLSDQVSGAVDDLTVTVAGYSCRENGATHGYGLVLVSLPGPSARIEVRHEPAFHSTLVAEPVPGGRVHTGVVPFDARYEVYASDPHRMGTKLSATESETLLAAPEPFSWRVHGRDVLLWRSGGWPSADGLLGCVRATVSVLRPDRDGTATGGAERTLP
ncbi:hypothetical protein ACIBJD_13260 [Kitasatospora sp. NPDC050467]|uniref:hypothetical protein n=1 Tax=Kitasatospora sp. NPDC050467 TaxID=3364053 RepID=UPI0037A13419